MSHVSPSLPLEFPQNHKSPSNSQVSNRKDLQLLVKTPTNSMSWVCHLSDNKVSPNGRPNVHRANDHQPLDYNIQIYSITVKSPRFPPKNIHDVPVRNRQASPGTRRAVAAAWRHAGAAAPCRWNGAWLSQPAGSSAFLRGFDGIPRIPWDSVFFTQFPWDPGDMGPFSY